MVWVSGFGEVPSDRLGVSCGEGCNEVSRRTLPSRVLSADERMKRMDPLDMIAVVFSEV